MTVDSGWNHNIHYHPVVLQAVPAAAGRALDVGCGDGALARKLRQQVPHVLALDVDEPALSAARAADDGAGVEYVLGDFMRLGLEPASFDFICSVAALHHMGAAAALQRMAGLLRPGGRLVIVGCARIGSVRDLVLEPAGMVAHRLLRLRRTFTEVTSPILWPPPETYGSMRRIARSALPGSSFRRRVLWRYTLTWEKQAS